MAKERSYDYFWNSNSDRYYDAESMADWLLPFFSNGVFNGQLQVIANDDMSVTVTAGYGYINGKHRHFTAETTLDLETASGTLDRIDAVMLRRDDTERMIYLTIEKGGNASSPVAPDVTRSESIYDLKLAEIYVAAGAVAITQTEITDTRMDSNVCGYVAATVEQIDFTQIQAQFDAYFESYKESIQTEFTAYTADIASLKEQAQDSYESMVAAFTEYENEQKTEFEVWVATIKDILDEEVAGHLQLEIEEITASLDEFKAEITAQVEAEIAKIEAAQKGFDTKTTVFNADGSITETDSSGYKVVTEFNADGSILQSLYLNDTKQATKTTVFNADGSISETSEWITTEETE